MRASTLRSKRWPGYDSRFYAHIISRALAEPLSRALRNTAMLRDVIPEDQLEGQYLMKIVDRYRAQHALEARAKAIIEEITQGNGTGTMLLKILDFKGLELTAEQRRMVETCEDTAQLDRWAERALDVKTAAELFA